MIETSPQIAEFELDVPQKFEDVETSQSEQIASQIRERLKPITGVEAAWLEDLDRTVNVYVIVNNFRNTTLHPIFDAQYDIESDYMDISFHFDINPIDLEQMQAANRIQRLF